MIKKRAVIIFVRKPELGKVKTRIAKSVGDEKALKIYTALLEHTQKEVIEVDASRLLFYTALEVNDDWPASHFQKHLQADGNLGNKLKAAFEFAFESCDQVIVIGSDCATLQSHHIEEAFDSLDDFDTVIGPTYDGGYYLLGMNEYNADIFEGINWSTETVFDETIAKIKSNHNSYHLLEMLSDIDHIEDWEKWGWELD